MSDILLYVENTGLKGAAIILILTITYKIYKMKIVSESQSDCCEGFKLKLVTKNNGEEG